MQHDLSTKNLSKHSKAVDAEAIENLYGKHEITLQQPDPSNNEPDYQDDFYYPRDESSYIQSHPEDILIQWRGPEYEVYPKSRQWYMIAAFTLAVIVAYAVWNSALLMAIVFILVGFVGYTYLQRPPRVRDFALTQEGVIVGNEIFDYDEIESFWIIYEPPHTRVISLHMKGKFVPFVHIPLHQRDPVDVREVLLQYLPEVKQEPSVIDAIERVLHI